MIRFLFYCCCCCFWMAVATAQVADRCGTVSRIQQAQTNVPQLLQQRAVLQARLDRALADGQPERQAVLRIPVVVHVLYNRPTENIPNQRIFEQIQVLNADFRRQNSDTAQTPADFLPVAADTEIEFCLATRDPNNQPTTGITRRAVTVANIGNTNDYYNTAAGGISAWDTDRYLNIWVCGIGGGTLGFAYPPGTAPAGADGVVIDPANFGVTGLTPPYNGGRTTTHEVGHYLDLVHLWGETTGGCAQDDGINDTPLQDGQSSGCRTHPSASCNSNDMFMNFMDYSDDACMNLFTEGQKTRMRAVLQNLRSNLIAPSAICVQLADDAGTQVQYPTVAVCSDSVRAQLELINYGNNALQSATLYYQLNQQTIGSFAWSGLLSAGQRTIVALPALALDGSTPSQRLKAWTAMPNGVVDANPNNDTVVSIFQATVAVPGPFLESFENTAALPNGWSISNPDNRITWAHTTQAASQGNAAFYVNNWNYSNQIGAIDQLETPPIQLQTNTPYALEFDLAYALYSMSGYSDTLRVYASSDCGQTWTSIYEKYDQGLTTAGRQTVEFFPTAADWRKETVDLSAFMGVTSLKFRFEHISEAENNLFLDRVAVTPTVAVKTLRQPMLAVELAPNPASSVARLSIAATQPSPLHIEVYNSLGQPILIHQETIGKNAVYELPTQAWAAGCYIVRVYNDTEQWTGQLIVE